MVENQKQVERVGKKVEKQPMKYSEVNRQLDSYKDIEKMHNPNSANTTISINEIQIYVKSMNHLKKNYDNVKEDTLERNGGRGFLI